MRIARTCPLPHRSVSDRSARSGGDRRFPARFGSLVARIVLLLLCAAAAGATASAQLLTASSGESFFIAIPWTTMADGHFIRANITAVSQCEVTVIQTESGLTETRTLMPGAKWEYVVGRTRIMLAPGEHKSNRTIHVGSTAPVTVNVVSDGPYVTDSYCALPISTYGTEYIAASYGCGVCTSGFGGVIAVVATQDDTEVRITPTALTIAANLPGYTFGVRLNRGEVYQVSAQNVKDDLSGSRITADKPVTVISGHANVNLQESPTGAQNALLEQVPPVVDWGKRFYVRPLPGQAYGVYKVFASRAGTTVRRNGQPLDTLAGGEHLIFTFDEPLIIETSEPAMVTQFTSHFEAPVPEPDSDPSMMVINPLESFAKSYQWMTPFLIPRIVPSSLIDSDPDTVTVPFEHYLMVTAPVIGRTSVRLDGRPIDFDRLALPHGDGLYLSAIIKIDPGVHQLTASTPINAQIFGYSHYDAYSSPAGVLMRDPFRAEPLTARTCRDFLDTLIDVMNVGGQQIKVLKEEFAGMTGKVTNPGFYPFEVLPFSGKKLRLRIELPDYGITSGTLTLTTTSGTRPLEIPITIIRDSMAFESVNDIAFGTMSGTTRDTILRIYNRGTGALAFPKPGVAGPFTVVSPSFPVSVPAGDSVDVIVRFAPVNPGEYAGTLSLAPTPCADPVQVTLSGRRVRAAAIAATVDPAPTLLCEDPSVDDLNVVIRNSGEDSLTIDSIAVEGDDRGDFILSGPDRNLTVPPGDSITLVVRFSPSGTGRRTAEMKIWSNAPGNSPMTTPLEGRRETVELLLSDSDIDFGAWAGCGTAEPRTLTIRNSGTYPVTIDSALPGGSDFIFSPIPSGTIVPGDSLKVVITPAIGAGGSLRDALRIFASPCDISYTVSLKGEAHASNIAFDADTLDFGVLPECATATALPLTIRNTGSGNATITIFRLDGLAFLATGAIDSLLPQGTRSNPVTINFLPFEVGDFVGEVYLRAEPCGMERRVFLRGSVRRPSVAAVADLDLGELKPGEIVRGTRYVTNNGELPVILSSIDVSPAVPGLVISGFSLPDTLLPGESTEIVITYGSDIPASFTTEISVTADLPCSLTTTSKVSGALTERLLELTLSLPDTTGELSQYIGLPLRIISPGATGETAVVTGEIRWEYRNLLFRGMTTKVPGGAITVTDTAIVGTERIVTFAYTGPLPPEGTLALLDVVVLLGPSESTPLRITAPAVTSTTPGVGMKVTGIDGSFGLTGVCRTDNRMIELMGVFRLGPISPNPVSTTANVTLEMPEGGHAVLRVLDPLGREALRPVDELLPAGIHSASIDVGGLPSGVYLLHFRTAGGAETTRRIVVAR